MNDTSPTDNTTSALGPSDGVHIVYQAIVENRPVIAILGQSAGWLVDADPVLASALNHLGLSGTSWPDLLGAEPLPPSFYEWLAGRFERRLPSAALEAISDAPFSAVFTSSLDPGIANLLASGGREPEPVILGAPQPRVLRSRRRPPVYYLFGRASGAAGALAPPSSVGGVLQRRMRHTTSMLNNVEEAATPLGLIVVEGFDPSKDWLRAEDLLAVLASAPREGILWCGPEPAFNAADAEVYRHLVTSGAIVRDQRSLAIVLGEAMADLVESPIEAWGEPELVTLADDRKLVVSPTLRLVTQISSSIVDDSWTSFLSPLDPEQESVAFHNFHGLIGNARVGFEGVRRGFSIERDFEHGFRERVGKALAHHQSEKGAIILHGQSGAGKSIALARLALNARKSGTAVLFAQGRVPQATDVSEFLQAVDELDGTTLLIVDATVPVTRYDDLFRSIRSLGHRVVVVGSSYRIDSPRGIGAHRAIEAPERLTTDESANLLALARKYVPSVAERVMIASISAHALARFYRYLPESRGRISDGLGREALLTERELRLRGARSRPSLRRTDTALGQALIDAGFGDKESPLFQEDGTDDAAGPAARVIDYVMSASRLFKSVPVGLLLRAVSQDFMLPNGAMNTDLLVDIFEGQDLFRWKFGDEEGADMLVGARLQIEAEIICNRRLGGPRGEAAALVDLIRFAHRAGPEDNEETRFVADIVQAMGPDGPAGDRYREEYAEIARALTQLRLSTGVMNGRLMLQESSLRRAYVRKNLHIDQNLKAELLVEATEAVDGALEAIDDESGKIYASRRTKEHLLVDRAATYGFLATDSAQRVDEPTRIWAIYMAARDAVRLASSRVDDYQPLDISLWLPTRLLKEAQALSSNQQFELKADLLASLDLVDVATLDPTQHQIFQRQRMSVAQVLDNTSIGDEAFKALEDSGSTVGYYLRAQELAPRRKPGEGTLSEVDIQCASAAAVYLHQHYDRLSTDPRCMQLLLDMEWAKATGRWLFRGLRQPLPSMREDRIRAKSILLDLSLSRPEGLSARFKYLEAVLTWLDGNEETAVRIWRDLDHDTRYVEAGRVLARHVITDERQQPTIYSGLVERHIAGDRWSIYVDALGRRVDLLAGSFPNEDLAKGRTVRNFAIAFNYRGPIADRVAARPLFQ